MPGLAKRDRVAWMSQQARYIAGQLVLRPSPLWQLVRRISGRKRKVGRLVAALKDEDGRVDLDAGGGCCDVGAKVS